MVGKKSLLKTSAEAVPYRKKSYHSIVVPIKLARITGLIDPVVATLSSLNVTAERQESTMERILERILA
jgi:hypothetical protein